MAKKRIRDEKMLDEMLQSEFEKARQEIIDRCMGKLHINEDKKTFRIWPPEINLDELFDRELCDLPFEFVVDRDPCSGEILSYREVVKVDEAGTGQTSLSLKRAPGPPGEDILGSTSKFPFFPGGMEEAFQQALQKQREGTDGQTVDFEHDLLSVPPGFDSGVDFKAKQRAISEEESTVEIESKGLAAIQPFAMDGNTDILSIMSMVSGVGADPFHFAEVEPREKTQQQNESGTALVDNDAEAAGPIIEEVISKPVVSKSVASRTFDLTGKIHEFAVVLDVSRKVTDFEAQVPVMAFTYPFELDTFQKQAIIHLEKGDSVFVAAHTSAGKTVVAEYAIALCKKHFTRAIYTSPIKALSNQKFRDFKNVFVEVGLLTGDIQLHKDSFCLIMTTEILRSMLYNGSDVIREVEWVIFDEVHYVNDSERGVVWEEVLIMLPRHVKIIMLSATVPNCVDFAEWVGRIKDRKVYVISTLKRPVPLEHFLYTGRDGKSKNNKFLLVDKDGTFLNHGYLKSMASFKEKKPTTGPKDRHTAVGHSTEKNIWLTVIDHLRQKDLLPMVVFMFSRKRCLETAGMLTNVDLTSSQEKHDITVFFKRCVEQLTASDRKLPQVLHMKELCKRGLAVHHSGILPILKEAIEMLFQSGCVKVLFATETFAMGVNMPARTVVFDSMTKFDGKTKRDLTSGEYTQMAGRAGRRGKDKTGTVILLCKSEVPEASDLHRMMKGKGTELTSKFRVTYSLILNSLRVEKIRIEEVLQRSFAERGTLRNVMKTKEALEECKNQLDKLENLNCAFCTDLEAYYDMCQEIVGLNNTVLRNGFFVHRDTLKLLTAGRVVLFSQKNLRHCIGLLLKASSDKRTLDVLIPEVKDATYLSLLDEQEKDESALALLDLCLLQGQMAQPLETGSKHSIVSVPLDRVVGISSKAVKVSFDAIIDDWTRRQQPRYRNSSPDRAVIFALRDLIKLIAGGPIELQFLDHTKDCQYSDIDVMTKAQSLKKLKSNLGNFSCLSCLSFQEHLLFQHRAHQLAAKYKDLLFQSSADSLMHMPDYKYKLTVLKELGYVDEHNILRLKGKVASSMNVFELVVTELMLENILNPLSPPEIAAALSFTTCQGVYQKSEDRLYLPPRLQEIKSEIDRVASRIYHLHSEYAIENNELGEGLRFELMEVTYEWALGTPFYQIMKITDVDEGIIVRCIQRLDEVARDVRNAARLVGDHALQQKMEEMSTLIKRDIVFAASLYTKM